MNRLCRRSFIESLVCFICLLPQAANVGGEIVSAENEGCDTTDLDAYFILAASLSQDSFDSQRQFVAYVISRLRHDSSNSDGDKSLKEPQSLRFAVAIASAANSDKSSSSAGDHQMVVPLGRHADRTGGLLLSFLQRLLLYQRTKPEKGPAESAAASPPLRLVQSIARKNGAAKYRRKAAILLTPSDRLSKAVLAKVDKIRRDTGVDIFIVAIGDAKPARRRFVMPVDDLETLRATSFAQRFVQRYLCAKVSSTACEEGLQLVAGTCLPAGCKTKCPSENFSQDESTCTCHCNMRCHSGLVLNRLTCTCQRVNCPASFEYLNGKCRPRRVRKLCPEGQVLIADVCKRGPSCPKGYTLKRNRSCRRAVGCKPGYKKTKAGRCRRMCPRGQYYHRGGCHRAKSCPDRQRQYFRVDAPLGCPRTCDIPVRLSGDECSRGPGCTCQPYYLLHKGRCIHPSDCPRVPVCIQKADVIFMLDSSLTVTERNFYLMKSFVLDVVQRFYLRSGSRQRVGVLRFNHRADILLDLNSWRGNSHEAIQKRISAIAYRPGLTFLGEALHVVRSRMWRRRAGMRRDAPRVCILLTDGSESNGQVDQYYESKLLRRMGVIFVTMVIGHDGQRGSKQRLRSLQRLAGPSGRVFVFGLRQFQDLHSLVSRVLAFRCRRPLCPHPYLIYGPCVGSYKRATRVEYIAKGYKCRKQLRQNYKRVRCACPKPTVHTGPCLDGFKTVTRTVHWLDKRDGICRSRFKDVRLRCSCPRAKVVQGECVNYKRTIVTNSFQLVRAGNGIHCRPKTSRKKVRCACPKPTQAEQAACVHNFKLVRETLYQLDRKNLTCVPLHRTHEVRCACPGPKVRTGRCDGSRVPVRVHQQRLNAASHQCDAVLWTGTAKCSRVCNPRLDLALLIDSSSSIRGTNFDYIRRFVVALARKFRIARDATRIALLKYSSRQSMKVVFNFAAHYSRASMSQRVRQMRYSPGATRTGEALQSLRHFLLNKINGFRGGRKTSSSVDCVVVLVTDGASNGAHDPVREADRVKALGCRIVTLGVGDDIRWSELRRIASTPADIHAFRAKTFRRLLLPDFVSGLFGATCRADGANRVSVRNKYSQIIRQAAAQGSHVNWEKFGFVRLNTSNYSTLKFKLIPDKPTALNASSSASSTAASVAMATPRQRSDAAEVMRRALAAILGLNPFSLLEPRILDANLSGSVRLPAGRVGRLSRRIRTPRGVRFRWRGLDYRIDPNSLGILGSDTSSAARWAALAPDAVLDAWRPLRRLVARARDAAPHIHRLDARSLAGKVVRRLAALVNAADERIDRLAGNCAVAAAALDESKPRRKSRPRRKSQSRHTSSPRRLLRVCALSTRRLIADAAKVVRRVGYIRYFADAGDWANMRYGEKRVNRRLGQARRQLSNFLQNFAVESPKTTPASFSPSPSPLPSLSPAERRHRALASLAVDARNLRRLHRALFAAHRLAFVGIQPALTRTRGSQLDKLDGRLRAFSRTRLAVTDAYAALRLNGTATNSTGGTTAPTKAKNVAATAGLDESATSSGGLLDTYLDALDKAATAADKFPKQAHSVATAVPAARKGLARLAPSLAAAAKATRKAVARTRRRLKRFRRLPHG